MQAKQKSFEFTSWGGARKGAGRKRTTRLAPVPHRSRARLAARHPLHVTLRLEAGLASLRKRSTYAVVREALAAGANCFGLRVVQYSVMSNHLHLVCEAADKCSQGRGIKGVCVRIARALNRLWKRSGRVFAERYHVHVLKTPREVRNALGYVLKNATHHRAHFAGLDPYSSAAWSDGWRSRIKSLGECVASPLPAAKTWLLVHGWRRHGLIDLDHT